MPRGSDAEVGRCRVRGGATSQCRQASHPAGLNLCASSAVGALMLPRGYYHRPLSTWRRQREVADLAILLRSGPQDTTHGSTRCRKSLAHPQRDTLRVSGRSTKTHLVIEVKKTHRAAGSANRQQRELMMAAAHELTPALGASCGLYAMGLWRGSSCTQLARSPRTWMDRQHRARTRSRRPWPWTPRDNRRG
jgi:hypothetical protein